MRYASRLLALCAIGTLVGCGSSGSAKLTGESNDNNNETPRTLVISGDLTPAVGQSVALMAMIEGLSSDSSTIEWQQTSGANVELVATNSAVLAFDIKLAGSYGFSVNVTEESGKNYTKEISLTTTDTNNLLNIRRDHAAREGNKVSLKLSAPVDPDTGNVVSGNYTNIKWAQVSGPAVTFNEKNINETVVIFNAPSVDKDTVLEFTATATHPNGETYNDSAYVLVQNTQNIKANAVFDSPVARVHAYNSNSRYAQATEQCVYSNYFAVPCSMSQLNLIGQDHTKPTVEDIMDRVVTSHPWMAENFKMFLEQQDVHGDFKHLLRSVSAIVISYDIRPSFYWVRTGAIYLDPEFFWLTPAQRDVIDVAPDFRSEFGQELQYIMPWRYVKNNQYAGNYYPKDLRITRTIEDLVPNLAPLLYHELAHANDIFPSSTLDDVRGGSVLEAFYVRNEEKAQVAELLTRDHPKTSAEMAALAQVNFHGASPTAEQIAYLPEDIAQFFSNDTAAAEYGYSSKQEDVATLFDATMMSYRYGIERDEAVTNPSTGSRDSIILAWGQRGRINDTNVAPRAKYVFELFMPELNSDDVFAQIPPAKLLSVGASWDDSINLDAKNEYIKRPRLKVRQHGAVRERPFILDIQRRYK
ncbi:hypothetical protein [Psychrobium sp. 1_MG-2023]|uniref:hypothetical protein n=1 Tax=Psychrobium sp. 1_MG-2023 TaxID=3062624 RepID=UPI000C32CDD4|nr:hypothetical protein [Psychrobium sp. 1_MG-2023]MDP2559676.1 hypothetical protein [Psychrobium sp. 1_MG-2023]PKF59507.1 hypothetical protein CW748_01675 [Alteromonadales bacterium alter-6D02]